MENARRLIDAGAHAVKLEGGASHSAHVEALVAEGIPAMAHIGMMPQRVRIEGGYRVKGKTPEDAARLLADARAAEEAGAFGLLLELVQANPSGPPGAWRALKRCTSVCRAARSAAVTSARGVGSSGAPRGISSGL